jgi:hypothetical protein
MSRSTPSARRQPDQSLSEQESLAREAVSKYNPDLKDITVRNTIDNFLGGTICRICYCEDNQYKECAVFVRSGRPTVHWDPDDVYRFVAADRYAPPWLIWLEHFSAPNFVISILSFMIILCSFLAFFLYNGNKEALSWIQAPMAIVIGFWFGRGYQTLGGVERSGSASHTNLAPGAVRSSSPTL